MEDIYKDKEKKKFFENQEQRDLWVRLNAERIRYSQLVLNNRDEQDLGDVDKPYSHLWVSNNQLTYDEYMEDQPRFSLAELSAMQHPELHNLAVQRNRETIKKLFGELVSDEEY